MSFIRQKYLEEIEDILVYVDRKLYATKNTGLTDGNLYAETLFMRLLNEIHAWKLINANDHQMNSAGIDLIDYENHIAIQVSRDSSAEKIQSSIHKFVNNYPMESRYRFIMLCIGSNKKRYSKEFSDYGKVYFNKHTDIWDISDLIAQLHKSEVDTDKLIVIKDLLDKEIEIRELAFLKPRKESVPTGISNNNPKATNNIYTFGQYFDRGTYLPIQWKQLDGDDDKILLISVKAIIKIPYYYTYDNCTWKESYIRHWLNNIFLKEAFNKNEIEKIIPIKVDTFGSKKSYDSVFLLSSDEYSRYLSPEEGIHRDINTNIAGFGWLRDTRVDCPRALGVHPDGTIRFNGYTVNNSDGLVRPAIWISPDALEKLEENHKFETKR